MAFIEIKRRCKDCENTRALLREVQSEIDAIRLDYHGLYEKVRVTLSRLAKREQAANTAQEKENGDDQEAVLARGREMILQKRFNR